MTYAKVLDKKTGNERIVTKKAYDILAGRRYELIEYLDEVKSQKEVVQATKTTTQQPEKKSDADPAAGEMKVREIPKNKGGRPKKVKEDAEN